MTDPTIDKAALEACPWCGLTEHLSVRAEGSYTPDMPARPYRVVCNHIDHDTVEGPIGYGRNGAIAAWNRRALPSTTDAVGVTVRELRWDKRAIGQFADTPFGSYWVSHNGFTSWWARFNGNSLGLPRFDTEDEAKSAAQADYTARIMASLNISEAEPVAFERELQLGIINRLVSLTVGTCSCDTKSPELKYHSETCRYRIASEALELARPLFASPTTSPQAPEGAWPKRRANVPYQGQEHQRLVGFVIERGDEAFGEYGLSEPLAWLDRMCAASLPHQSPEGALATAARELIASRFDTYRAGNNRQVGIQDDNGEKCWIVPFDEMAALEAALKGNRT